MVVLLVFAKLAGQASGSVIKVALVILVLTPIIVFAATLLVLFSSVFFGWPTDLRPAIQRIISPSTPSSPQVKAQPRPTPTATP
jgi:hypothetical protein